MNSFFFFPSSLFRFAPRTKAKAEDVNARLDEVSYGFDLVAAQILAVPLGVAVIETLSIVTGSVTFTLAATGKAFVVGQWMYVVDPAAPSTRWIQGTVTAFNAVTGVMTVLVTRAYGTGTIAAGSAFQSSPGFGIGLTVSPTGDVGINTAAPAQKLDVVGTAQATLFVGPLTGNVTGNATTATTLATARTIGGTSFNGSANIAVNLAATATALATARTIGGTSFDGTSNIAVALAATATALATPRAINGVAFDGTAPITVPGSTLMVDSLNTTAPNATVPVAVFTVTNGSYANIDAAFMPKGTGALTAQVADNVSVGGNKRGANAVDWQMVRGNSGYVAAGARSVICGGSENTTNTANSFIGGGQSNSVTTNTHGAIAGGLSNLVSGQYGFVGGGNGNTASGFASTVAGGNSNTASGNYSFAAGDLNTASGLFSAAFGRFGTTRGRDCSVSVTSNVFSVLGSAQYALMTIGKVTTDATPAALTTDAGAISTINQYIVANNSANQFSILVIAGVTGAGNSKSWTITGLVKRGANAASTALVGTPVVTSNYADAGASSWVIAVTADTTNGGITLTATGQAATTIRWVATVQATEMTY